MYDLPLAIGTLLVVGAMMLAEAARSARHEAALRRQGAVEPRHDVYGTMRWAYPACFVAMAVEGAVVGTASRLLWTAGIATFALAKALKYWGVRTLGERWTFRVLVVRGAPLVRTGPYRYLRHPNYVAVVGELAGMALMMGARFTGPLAMLIFGAILAERIRIENQMLKLGPKSR